VDEIFGTHNIRADQHRQQTEQTPHQPVDEQQHLEMVPATALTSQQNPSSQRETEFSSGTTTIGVRLAATAIAITAKIMIGKDHDH
jgi:hypothetical protein